MVDDETSLVVHCHHNCTKFIVSRSGISFGVCRNRKRLPEEVYKKTPSKRIVFLVTQPVNKGQLSDIRRTNIEHCSHSSKPFSLSVSVFISKSCVVQALTNRTY